MKAQLARYMAGTLGCLALGYAVSPAESRVDTHYAKWKLGQPFGYRDLKMGPTRWKVRGMSYHTSTDFAAATALYRSAIHAKARGFADFYTVSFKLICTNPLVVGENGFSVCQGLSEEADIISVGYQQGGVVPTCEEKQRWVVNCRSFVVAETLARLGTYLKVTAQKEEQEVAEAKLALLKVQSR